MASILIVRVCTTAAQVQATPVDGPLRPSQGTPVTPSMIQYLLARGFVRSTCTTAFIIAGLVAWRLCPALSLFRDVWFVFHYVFAIILIWPLGWFLGAYFVWPFVSAFTTRLNGAPFQVGDMVHVLTGPHRDRVTCVYDVWRTRDQLRIDLGEIAKAEVTDVFDYTDICRERPS